MIDTDCPEDEIVHPRLPSNTAGLTTIEYRVGDFATFRRALLRALPNEAALDDWHPTVEGDLAVQLLEWWAYLADVLTFYNEQALSEALLRTARQPENVRRIVRLLGYRPRPGIGATGVVAALTNSPRPFVLPRGMPIQGSVDVGPPQVFELDEDVEIGVVGRPLPRSARFPKVQGAPIPRPVVAERLPDGRLRDSLPARRAPIGRVPPLRRGRQVVIALDGAVTNLAPDDTVVMLPRDWNGMTQPPLATVDAVEPNWDEEGRPFTELTLIPRQDDAGGQLLEDCQVMKPTKSAHLWLYHDRYPGPKLPQPGSGFLQGLQALADPAGIFTGGISKEPPQDAHVFTSKVEQPERDEGAAHLEGITRGINPGDPVLFEQSGGAAASGGTPPATFFTRVTGYDELIWYANPPESDRIGQGPPIGPPSGGGLLSSGPAPIPIPHSVLSFLEETGKHRVTDMVGPDDELIKTIVVHYAWEEVAPLVEGAQAGPTTEPEISETGGAPTGTPAIVEDSTGTGTPVVVGVRDPSGSSPPLFGPLRALLNLLPVSRGQTVASEVLGSGDPTIAGQEFTLARGPLTYLTDTDPGPFDGYRSTLRVRVADIEWHEVASFYGQRADARVFVTREDEAQRTHVHFGDGVHGARLPAGIDNVVADYRIGSGAAVPPIGALTTMLRPQPGVTEIRNPILPGGGADPDPPEQIRRYGPRSVLTFGRAVSGDDYETIAAQTPGVTRARAVWGWDAASQRTTVKVLVGDDAAAVVAARGALRSFADPNRPVMVALAEPVYVDLRLTVEVDANRDADAVAEAVRAALVDPLALPFGKDIVRIGDPIYNSEIYDVCLDVPGVNAVHGLVFRTSTHPRIRGLSISFGLLDALTGRIEHTERHTPGAERFYALRADRLRITAESNRHGH